MIKMYNYDSSAREQAKKAKEEKEAKEHAERERANQILQEHGISQSTAL